jgi:hypothetical protein
MTTFHHLPISIFAFLGLTAVVLADDPKEKLETNPEQAEAITDPRKPKTDTALRYWLENMVWHHSFSGEEVVAATGLTSEEIGAAQVKYDISLHNAPQRKPGDPLRVLPYPGGRHPRIGFLDGAINPQRETKVSVFTPWDPASYVVVDVPEAIWSNLGLTYLAHTHVPTIWSLKEITLEQQEWSRLKNGSLQMERKLPNGIVFGSRIVPHPNWVEMEMWLKNGTKETLTDLRVQNCVMLKGAKEFNGQTNENKMISKPFVVARNEKSNRWIIAAWDPCDRPWANHPVPCLHSDPKFPDCKPGETKKIRGWLSFYEGKEIKDELERIKRVWPKKK